MLLQSCACWSRKGRMTGSDRRCIRPLTIARSLASRKPWRAVDGGGLRGRHDRIGQARLSRLCVSRSCKAIGGNERGIAIIAGSLGGRVWAAFAATAAAARK